MEKQSWKKWVYQGVHEVIQYLKVHKWKAVSSFSIITFLSVSTAFAHHVYESNMVDVYHVYLHGEEIGTVGSKDVIDTWIEVKKRSEEYRYQGIELAFDEDDITLKHEKVYKGEYHNAATLDALNQAMEVKAKAYKLVVDGELIGYVKDQATGEAILEKIKNKYLEQPTPLVDKKKSVSIASVNDSPTIEVKEVSIKEDVDFAPTIIDPEKISSEEEIVSLLEKGTLEEKTYQVQEGDCLGCIAEKFDLSIEEIKQLNPGIDEDTVLQIGQTLNVTALKPKVTVQSLLEKTQTESIPYKTEYIKDDSLYKGETKVKQEGVKGKKKVTYSITEENGIEISREVIAEKVISEPVTRIVRQGTKTPPTVSTGIFQWPTKGGKITSKYGWRWGRMHKGIDISGVKDKTIMAADNGKVIHVGRKGDYGNTIIIDHGNGYQTLYGHLSSYSVKEGQQVAKGQKIGVMGNTGRSTGTHLHFEIIKNGKNVNPSDAF